MVPDYSIIEPHEVVSKPGAEDLDILPVTATVDFRMAFINWLGESDRACECLKIGNTNIIDREYAD